MSGMRWGCLELKATLTLDAAHWRGAHEVSETKSLLLGRNFLARACPVQSCTTAPHCKLILSKRRPRELQDCQITLRRLSSDEEGTHGEKERQRQRRATLGVPKSRYLSTCLGIMHQPAAQTKREKERQRHILRTPLEVHVSAHCQTWPLYDFI